MKYSVVIPAAGQGRRMQAKKNKPFIILDGKPVIAHTVKIFQEDPNCKEIIIVANQKEIADFHELACNYQFTKVSQIVIGGKERQDSVYEGLKCLRVEADGVVLIHDGARPFVTHNMIRQVAFEASHSGAAVLAVPVKDTIKRVNGTTVLETVERSSLWAVQTPQAFRLAIIKKAHQYAQKHHILATDDAELVEITGKSVSIVEGHDNNIKLTTPHDLLVAGAILQELKGEPS